MENDRGEKEWRLERTTTTSRYDSSDMAAKGRIGGYARAAKYSPEELTGAARRGFMARFEPQDPDLTPAECERRTQAAFKGYMSRLTYLSAQARRRRK